MLEGWARTDTLRVQLMLFIAEIDAGCFHGRVSAAVLAGAKVD
jgi:hypothetical protein